MAKRGAAVAVALANCEPFAYRRDRSTTAPGEIPFVETPIYLVNAGRDGRVRLRSTPGGTVDEVYANVPDEKPTC